MKMVKIMFRDIYIISFQALMKKSIKEIFFF